MQPPDRSDVSAETWEMYEMFLAFLQAPLYHLALEAVLFILVIWLLFHKSYKPQRTELTEKEKDQLIAEWVPEPLVPESDENHYSLKPRIVSGKVGKVVMVDGKKCLNAATHNYLGLVEHPQLEEAALKCLRKYGVGSCGPRGFYGTVDIHLELEAKLAEFMNVEEAVLYSYGFSTISSAIPAYAKHGDVIFADEGVNFSIQKGLVGSRSEVYFFKHNDPNDLERLLKEQEKKDQINPRRAKVTRRFLVLEGIYLNYGDICNLPRMVELKNKYKVRLFIDEACSFGVLGSTGRGVTEHFNIPRHEIDLITATLEAAIPSFGGFCVGTSFIVDHQRLSGLGYCFSASLPPLQAGVAIAALSILESNPGIIEDLKENCVYMHDKLLNIPELLICSDPVSPVKHLYLAEHLPREQLVKKLEAIVHYGMAKGVALTVARYLDAEEHKLPPPSIRLITTAILKKEDLDLIASVLQEACKETALL
ncbi:serine palmitoyltransferase 1-like [Uloborus diversus]|uniref:serine palmitoyltransferase 1-like n=1 Tax=Uloborus diversus TaxID=327109 RepID=UPI0024099D29|nr:serine palmitoyltransferase 1-like [Uloborus diversus]